MKSTCLAAASLAALSFAAWGAPFAALAQTTAPPTAPTPDLAGSGAATEAETVVVTANRSPTPISQVGQSITVLTTPELRLDQETTVADILARTPGVTLSRNGGPGETSSLYIRGAESAQTVVLIDGVKVNDPTDPSTGYDFANLTTGDISRIEVLRGPQSTLYGSEAVGGVVNVITADATRPLEGDLQAEGGSYGTAYVKGAIGGKEDRYDWRLGAYYNSTDSVSAFDRAMAAGRTTASTPPASRAVSATTSPRTCSSTSAPTTPGAATSSTASTPLSIPPWAFRSSVTTRSSGAPSR